MSERMEHLGFVSKEYTNGKRVQSRNYSRRNYDYGRYSRERSSGSMLAKIGICGMLCALVMFINHFNSSNVLAAAAIESQEDIGGEYLGKLRFVELPGIIEVFSSDAKLKVGMKGATYTFQEDGTVLAVTGCGKQNTASPAAGEVKQVGKDGEKLWLELALSNDVVIAYSGLSSVNVEEGQPVKKGDTLFETEEAFQIRVYHKGRPADVSDYFDTNQLKVS